MRGPGLLVMMTLASGSGARAEATCAVELRGDAAVTEPIRAELQSFDEDGAPCVAVQVSCRRDGDQLEIELRDELGRSSLRVFTSPVGAAAFVVSWSKRPVMGEIVVPPPVAVPPPPGAARSFGAPPEQGLHPELAVTMIESRGARTAATATEWAVATASLIWNHRLPDRGGSVRYGGGLRAVTAIDRYLRAEAEAMVGVITMLPRAFRVRLDVIGGVPLGEIAAGYMDYLGYGLMGRRVGAAVTISKRLVGSLDVELGGGYDLSWLSLNSPCARSACDRFDGLFHGAAGVRWTL